MTTHLKCSLARTQKSWGVSVEMIHGLIECRQVKSDFYNVAVSLAYGMNWYMSLSFVNTGLR